MIDPAFYVWVVLDGSYEGEWTVGIYASEEAAKKALPTAHAWGPPWPMGRIISKEPVWD